MAIWPLLQHIVAVEYGERIACRFAARTLADLGASVIKVIGGGAAEDRRSVHAPPLDLYLDFNKKFVRVSSEAQNGGSELKQLLERAHIVIEDGSLGRRSRRSGLEAWGKVATPVVWLSITPFGATGPYKDYSSYSLTLAHGSGEAYMNFTGDATRPPVKWWRHEGDFRAGIAGAVAGLAALLRAQSTGGEYIDVSEQEALMSMNLRPFGRYLNQAVATDRQTLPHRLCGPFACQDGYVECFAPRATHLVRLGRWMKKESLAQEAQTGVSDAIKRLNSSVADWVRARPKEELFREGQANDVLVAPYYGAHELSGVDQFRHRAFFAEEKKASGETRLYATSPAHFRRLPSNEARREPPTDYTPGENDMANLNGLRVLDLSSGFAGPWAASLLAMLGAEVIKVESAVHPDISRMGWDPFTQRERDLMAGDFSFVMANPNKVSMTVDLASTEGVMLVKQLATVSDVLVENFTPGVMARLGLGYEDLRQVRPDIILLSISAFGQTGPLSHYRGVAPLFGAAGGLSSLSGYEDHPPTVTADERVDGAVASYGALATLAALTHRDVAGEGAHIDLSATEVVAYTVGDAVLAQSMGIEQPHREGNGHPFWAIHNVYPCRGEDQWLAVAVYTDEEWAGLCGAIGSPELMKDPRFDSRDKRLQHNGALDEIISVWTSRHDPDSAMSILQTEGVAAVRSFSTAELFADPHTSSRMVTDVVHHPTLGSIMVISPPWKLHCHPAVIVSPSPLLGQHTKWILGDILAIPQEHIERLESEGFLK